MTLTEELTETTAKTENGNCWDTLRFFFLFLPLFYLPFMALPAISLPYQSGIIGFEPISHQPHDSTLEL
jgi:hypothetical protein